MSPVGTKIPPNEWVRIQKLALKNRRRDDGNRPPRIYGYLRCSHPSSAFSQYGLDAQRSLIEQYITRLLEDEEFAGHEPGGIFCDKAVSASKIPFLARREGQKLNAQLRPGDVVVFPRVDRGFRQMQDFCNLLQLWLDRGVTALFAQENGSFCNWRDRQSLYMCAIMAEGYSHYVGERNRETAAIQKARRGQSGGKARYGYKWTGPRGKRRLIPDREQRKIGQLVVRIVDKHSDWSWQEVSDEVHRRLAAAKGESLPPLAQRKGWCRSVCKTAYREERKLQSLEREQREKKQQSAN